VDAGSGKKKEEGSGSSAQWSSMSMCNSPVQTLIPSATIHYAANTRQQAAGAAGSSSGAPAVQEAHYGHFNT
jgi:hypothetical protein